MAIDAEVPSWCRWRRGTGAVLVIAPHGGRREPIQPRPGVTARMRKVNDLHTADLAEELADALGASLIVNPSLDRNRLDLNRISQVTARAPWFLGLIETLVADILDRHPRAELVFVHGWNVIQPKCDIGVGRCLTDADAAATCADVLTVSAAYAAERLGRLHDRCAAAGIAMTFGDRYPARHPNNLLHLFRNHDAGPPRSARLAEWTSHGRIEAVQLELGVPVRWPGSCRRDFVHAARAAFGDAAHVGESGTKPSAAAASARAPSHPRVAAAPATGSDGSGEPIAASLQLYDPRADVALTARVDSGTPPSAGRVLLFVGRRRLALFLGEDVRSHQSQAGGPRFTATPEGFRLRFDGPALAGDDGALYWDLEQAFAASHLCRVAVDLTFRRQLGDDFGIGSGWVDLEGERHPIEAPAFARHGVLSGASSQWCSQVTLTAAFAAQRALRVRHEFPGANEWRELTARGESVRSFPSLHVGFTDDRYTPQHIEIGSGMLVCEPRSRMSITRPLAPHRQARVTFGAARFLYEGSEGFGFYEYARAL